MSIGTHRLFCAIFPPGESVLALLADLSLLELPPNRPVPAAQVHLTALFVGPTPGRELAAAEESVRSSARGLGPFVLTPRRLVSLPVNGTARLVAVETDAPATLMELHRRLVSRLAGKARAHNTREFLPHLTLCRFAGAGVRMSRVDQASGVPAFEVRSVALMESVLHSTGAEYRTRATLEFGR